MQMETSRAPQTANQTAGQQFLGHWRLSGTQHWDDYLKAAGIGFLLRTVANNTTSYEHWQREGDHWSVHITSTFKNKMVTFQLDREFDEQTMDGRNVKSLFRLEGDKLIHKQTATKPHELTSTIVREILPDGRLLATFVAENKDVTAKVYFAPYTA